MIISLLQEKGGVGKTTIAINLACAFKAMNYRVLLVDADPQGSTRDWHTANQGTKLDVIGLDRPTIDKDIKRFSKEYDCILIDGAPHISTMATKIILCSDVVLIPVTPSPFDVWASQTLVELIKQRQEITGGLPKTAFVISRQVSQTKIGKEAREVLKEYGLPVLSAGTFSRTIYPEMAATGKAAVHFPARNAASDEIMALCIEVEKFSGMLELDEEGHYGHHESEESTV